MKLKLKRQLKTSVTCETYACAWGRVSQNSLLGGASKIFTGENLQEHLGQVQCQALCCGLCFGVQTAWQILHTNLKKPQSICFLDAISQHAWRWCAGR